MTSKNVNNLKQVDQESEENPYECKICFKRFSLPGKLNHHTRSTHNKTYNFKCDICKKLFQTKHVLERHKSVHGNREAYPCDSCDMAFPDKHRLSVINLFTMKENSNAHFVPKVSKQNCT